MNGPRLRPARLGLLDLIRLGSAGIRTRPTRVLLSALGIAIGVGAMIAVVGISSSSQAEVNRRLEALGTNVLRVAPGQSLQGGATQLPATTLSMVSRIGPVQTAAAVADLHTAVYRNDHMPKGRTNSLTVMAAQGNLLGTVNGHLQQGVWFNQATGRYPAVVLGQTAADRLNVQRSGTRVWISDQWFSLVGILRPVALAPELDSAALIGWPAATDVLHSSPHPSVVYVRTDPDQVQNVYAVLPRTAKPANPAEVDVSRPSDALAAKEITDNALTGLLLGLGGVALLVGAVGAGNTMIISVLERRSEIGLRRSLGATRRQVLGQFLAESLLLCVIGGVAGSVLGIAVTAGYAMSKSWPTVVPVWASLAGVGVTLLAGALAGLYPAIRASRLSPTEALTVG